MREFWESGSLLKPLVDVYNNNNGANNCHDTIDENRVKAHHNGSQSHWRHPKNYYACFKFIKLAVKILLTIFGAGIMKKKQKNTHAFQIMDKLVSARKKLYYGREGMISDYDREELHLVVGDDMEKPTSPETKPFGEAPILVAAKRGVIEMVKKILEDIPAATLDRDHDDKNIVLLVAEHGHPHIYNYLLKSEVTQSLFVGVDRQGNSALHLAARFKHERFCIAGAAFQMRSESRWYERVKSSRAPGVFARYNNNRKTAQEIFTKSHKDLIKEARKWFISASASSSVVAAVVATVAYTCVTSVPGGNNQNTGKPMFEGQPAFQVFAISSLITFCFSATALVVFLDIITSRFHESEFATELPTKLFGGMAALSVSIAANLVSFCAGHFYIIHNKLESRIYFLYAGLIFPLMAFFFTSQRRLYADLIRAGRFEKPERPTYLLHF